MQGESANPTWSDKRERQYEHIKEGLLDRGEGEETAEEIAARTVNKERARNGEAVEPSRTRSRTSRPVAGVACARTAAPVAAPIASSTPRPSAGASTVARR